MQVKKSPKADLEKKKFLFVEIGLVLALAICLFFFERTTEDVGASNLGGLAQTDMIEEEIDITQQQNEPPPPEEQPEEQPEPEQIIEELVIVDNDEIVDDIRINTEADDRTRTSTNIVASFEIEEDEYIEPVSFAVVEEKPTFPGGDVAIMKFIQQNTVYPSVAKELGVQGRVFVQFVIDVNGKVTQVQIAQGVDAYLDAEAIRVVNLMPNWTPGRQRGKNVPVTYIVPINFKLS